MPERPESGGLPGGDGFIPVWWPEPYRDEFPNWHVFDGVGGLRYARRLRTSPPLVIRGESAHDLYDQMKREEAGIQAGVWRHSSHGRLS